MRIRLHQIFALFLSFIACFHYINAEEEDASVAEASHGWGHEYGHGYGHGGYGNEGHGYGGYGNEGYGHNGNDGGNDGGYGYGGHGKDWWDPHGAYIPGAGYIKGYPFTYVRGHGFGEGHGYGHYRR